MCERPKTRGELKKKLQEGITCEVAEFTAEMTKIILTGWLEFYNFTIQPSYNHGWVLFVPTI